MSWSRLVASVGEAADALAHPGDELDLRAFAELDPAWSELGFTALAASALAAPELTASEPPASALDAPVPGELVRPVPVRLDGAEATRALGARLAAALAAGDLVVLSGPLGAGKTTLTQGIAAALGVRGAVTSPSYVLSRTHPGPLPLVHVDAYRLLDDQAAPPAGLASHSVVDDLGLDDELPTAVVVVEWGAGLVEHLSPDYLHVALTRAAGADQDFRTASVLPHGRRWSRAAGSA